MTRQKIPQKTRSSLRVLATILIVSAVSRIAGHGTLAVAQDAIPDEIVQSVDNTVLGVPFTAEAIDALLSAFRAREDRLLEREEELAAQDDLISASEIRITEKIEELTNVERKLASTLALADSAADNDLARLANVYENMKPKDTAALFTEMSPGFAAGFLGLMQPDSAAAVMTELEPEVAHTISVMLAGRNANAFNIE
jgi:flagellar motility protein MotE (MotC chaperone)